MDDQPINYDDYDDTQLHIEADATHMEPEICGIDVATIAAGLLDFARYYKERGWVPTVDFSTKFHFDPDVPADFSVMHGYVRHG